LFLAFIGPVSQLKIGAEVERGLRPAEAPISLTLFLVGLIKKFALKISKAMAAKQI
jgi:hypothetical protein